MHEGRGKVIFIFVLLIAFLAFAFFFAFQFSRDARRNGSATTTPLVAATTTQKTATTTERLSVIRRFFSWLGYDLKPLSRPSPRPPSPPLPRPPAPAPKPPPPSPSPNPRGPLPTGFTEADLSPYYGQITIGSLSHPDLSSLIAFRTRYSEVALRVSIPEGERVNVTGWRVKSNSGSFTIPGANEVLPATAYENRDPIRLARGHTLRIFSRLAPVALNFRLNSCTGYQAALNFVPNVPRSCPAIYADRSELSLYSPECHDYVLTLSRCELPSSQPPIKYNDSQCFDLLSRASYEQCLARHRNDPDFLKNEWRVWLGNPSNEQVNIFNARHDRVLLFDQNGKLVDEHVY